MQINLPKWIRFWKRNPKKEEPNLPVWQQNLLEEEKLKAELLKQFGQNSLEIYGGLRRNRKKMGEYIQKIGDSNIRAVLLRQLGQEEQQTRIILSQMLTLTRQFDKKNSERISQLEKDLTTKYEESQARLAELETRAQEQAPAIEDIVKATMPTLTKRMNSRDVKAVLGVLLVAAISGGVIWWLNYRNTEAGKEARIEELETTVRILREGPKTKEEAGRLLYFQQFQKTGDYKRDIAARLDNQTTSIYNRIEELDNSTRSYVNGQFAQKMGVLDKIKGQAEGADKNSTTAVSLVTELQRKSNVLDKTVKDLEQKVGTSSNKITEIQKYGDDIEKLKGEYSQATEELKKVLPREEYNRLIKPLNDSLDGLTKNYGGLLKRVEAIEKKPAENPKP